MKEYFSNTVTTKGGMQLWAPVESKNMKIQIKHIVSLTSPIDIYSKRINKFKR